MSCKSDSDSAQKRLKKTKFDKMANTLVHDDVIFSAILLRNGSSSWISHKKENKCFFFCFALKLDTALFLAANQSTDHDYNVISSWMINWIHDSELTNFKHVLIASVFAFDVCQHTKMTTNLSEERKNSTVCVICLYLAVVQICFFSAYFFLLPSATFISLATQMSIS